MNKLSRGFTVIEIVLVAAVLGIASVIFFIQKNNIEVAARDEQRKTAINAIHYSLEEVYFKNNNGYPRTVSATILPSVEPGLFKDTNGVTIGEGTSEYRYEPLDCNGERCAGYSLRTSLENEDDYVKTNR